MADDTVTTAGGDTALTSSVALGAGIPPSQLGPGQETVGQMPEQRPACLGPSFPHGSGHHMGRKAGRSVGGVDRTLPTRHGGRRFPAISHAVASELIAPGSRPGIHGSEAGIPKINRSSPLHKPFTE